MGKFRVFIALVLSIASVLFIEAFCFARFLAGYDWGLTHEVILLIAVLLLSSFDFFIINYKLNSVSASTKPKCLLSVFGLLAVLAMSYLIFIPNPVLKVALQDCVSVLIAQAMILFNSIWAILKKKG